MSRSEPAQDDQLECLGGPLDGQFLGDRGMFWRVVVRPEESETGEVELKPGWSGAYVQRDGAYYWEADC